MPPGDCGSYAARECVCVYVCRLKKGRSESFYHSRYIRQTTVFSDEKKNERRNFFYERLFKLERGGKKVSDVVGFFFFFFLKKSVR